jgi:hypothetical protein
MNIRQLKETLEQFPDDMEVVGWDSECDSCFKILSVQEKDFGTSKYKLDKMVVIEQYFQ